MHKECVVVQVVKVVETKEEKEAHKSSPRFEFTRLRGYDKWQFKFYWNDVIFKIMLYVVCFCCPLQQRNSLVFKIDNISSRVQTNKKLEQMTFSLDSEICESICKWLFAKLFVYSHVESEEKKTIVFLQSMFVKSSTDKGEYWLVQGIFLFGKNYYFWSSYEEWRIKSFCTTLQRQFFFWCLFLRLVWV